MSGKRRQSQQTTAFCRTCNARERAIVDGRCIVCGCDPKASSPVGLTPKAQPHDGQDPKRERCPYTGRSASACDSSDHRNCPDLRLPEEIQ